MADSILASPGPKNFLFFYFFFLKRELVPKSAWF